MPTDTYDDDLERGLSNRRAILGDAWVDRSLANATSFNADFQHLISRTVWHEIWSRPGLDHKTRRVIVLAITIALGRWEEFELHTRAALMQDALTSDELKEVLLQAAAYAGVPAANTAFALATKVLRELGHDLPAADPLQVAHRGVGRIARTVSRPALHYTVRESSAAQPRATLVLSHALGCDSSMWDALATSLADDYRVVAYDHRGHGHSETPPGPYTIADLADDAARLVQEATDQPVVFIGLSMGGMVAQELALRHPALVRALVIANSTGGYPDEAQAMWQQRIDTVRAQGMAGIVEGVLGRYFSDAFRAQQAGTVARFRRRLLATAADGYLACCEAVRRVDTLGRLPQLMVPALVLAGEADVGTPVAFSQSIVERLPGARLAVLPGAAHLSVVERPAEFGAAVRSFLAAL